MKWGATKKARQQINRMKGSYTRKDGKVVKYQIHNDAIDVFLNAQKVIQESSMSRKDKSAAIERAAERFLASGMGTRRGIMEKFAEFKLDLPEEEIVTTGDGSEVTINPRKIAEEVIGKDWKKAAEYMDATEEHKREMELRHYAGSAAIQQIADMQEAGLISKNSMYSMFADVTNVIASKGEISPDELQGIIMDLYESYRG